MDNPNSSQQQQSTPLLPGNRPGLNSRRAYLILVIFLVLLSAISFYAYRQNHLAQQQKQELQKYKSQAGDAGQNETKKLIEAVGKLIVLPADEPPTVATVTDLAKLQGQPFFANAAVGDKV